MAIATPTPRLAPPAIAANVARLDRSSPLPLWAQLETDLRRRLEDGEFDDAFPTDLMLTEAYEVSRHTVREAVRQL
ncbi:MAG: GntR family transcriptional regulator, partial [Acidimicrobiaceae bacterium]|nr:GntR family transcriptional regulator [Acidimicrobiaceae bacterium]